VAADPPDPVDAPGAAVASPPPVDAEAARARSLALLEATHEFPCHYQLTVIALNRDPVTEAVREVVTVDVDLEVATLDHKMTASGGGKYLSHRFLVPVAGAAEVLELYARVRTVDGVVMIL
jgi:putative lipoic acid-binding regulatory protein